MTGNGSTIALEQGLELADDAVLGVVGDSVHQSVNLTTKDTNRVRALIDRIRKPNKKKKEMKLDISS